MCISIQTIENETKLREEEEEEEKNVCTYLLITIKMQSFSSVIISCLQGKKTI